MLGDASSSAKGFATSVAPEWPLSSVHGHVVAKLLTSFAALTTLTTLEWQLSSVCHHVYFEGVGPGKGSATVCAQVVSGQSLFLMLVEQVGLELAVGGKPVATVSAAVRLFSSVNPLQKSKMEYKVITTYLLSLV